MRLRYCCTLMLFFFLFVSTTFAHDVPCKEESSFDKRLVAAELQLEKIAVHKENKDSSWKKELEEAYLELRRLSYEKQNSSELYLLFAKSYRYNDNISKAIKATEKALFFKPLYIDALILMGDLHTETIMRNFYDETGDADLYFYSKRKKAVESYETALKIAEGDHSIVSGIYLKLGDLNNIFPLSKKTAKDYWKKAYEIAPESSTAKMALERLQKN